MCYVEALPRKHRVTRFARDLVQYDELIRGWRGGEGGRGCKSEEAASISSMGHLGFGLLRDNPDLALPRLVSGCKGGIPVCWGARCVVCNAPCRSVHSLVYALFLF